MTDFPLINMIILFIAGCIVDPVRLISDCLPLVYLLSLGFFLTSAIGLFFEYIKNMEN